MMMRYVHTNALCVPAIADSVEVDAAGGLRGWRSVADGAVGSFGGRLEQADLHTVRAALEAVRQLPGPQGLRVPDSGTETLERDGHDPVVLPSHLDRPWGEMADAARRLITVMMQFPTAAIALVVDGEGARLRHLGSRAVGVDLSHAQLRVTWWRGYYEPAGDSSTPLAGPREQAEPGWSHQLPVDLTPPDGGAAAGGSAAGGSATAQVCVTFTLIVDGVEVPAQVTASESGVF